MDNITVIIRSVGERTEKLCINKAEEYFGKHNVFCVRNICPFSKAIRESFRIGIENNKKWTFVIDADVFLYEDRIATFMKFANKMYDEGAFFCATPYLYDNFFMKGRPVGAHLYNTSMLSKAISFCEDVGLRPETYVKKQMVKLGVDSYNISYILGIHDYFQSYESIVEKGILHSHKHSNINELIQGWEKYKNYNSDFKWILEGVKIGGSFVSNDVVVDKMWMRKQIERVELDIPCKPPLAWEEVQNKLSELKSELVYEKISVQKKSVQQKSREQVLKDALLNYSVFAKLKSFKDKLIINIRK